MDFRACFTLALFFISFAALSFSDQASDQESVNQCICYDSCWEAGWDCSVVSCGYNPNAVSASPDCADTSLGQCVCQGFGCGRAPMNLSKEAECRKSLGLSLNCASGQVELDGQCVDENSACKASKEEYDLDHKTCRCELGYYYNDNKECITPGNRERKDDTQGLRYDTLKSTYGTTVTKTYTFNARCDAVGDTVFYMGNVFPQYMKSFVSISPQKLYLKPCESGTITVTVNLDEGTFRSEDSVFITFLGLDDKYQYKDTGTLHITIPNPAVKPEMNQVVEDNTQVMNNEITPPPMPTESSGNVFEDVKSVIRASAFGTEAAAKMESIVDMYASDPQGDKDLLTALAAVGLFPTDQIQNTLSAYSKGATTIGEVTKSVAEDYLDAQKEEALKKVVDVTGLLSMDAKEQVYKNLANVLPKMLQYKYTVESEQKLFKKEMELQNKANEPLEGGN